MVASLDKPQSHTIEDWLGNECESLLTHKAKVSKDLLHLPRPDWVERIFEQSDRFPQTLRSLKQLYGHGCLAQTGYLSVLPVGRKAFQRPMAEGVKLLHAIQDVYLSEQVTVV